MNAEEPNLFDPDTPILPYSGTSGHSGSDTSEERARREDRDGTTSKRQRATLTYLSGRGQQGATWVDLGSAFNLNHGQASGVLSVLHGAGKIERLTERRHKCLVYVAPEYVAGRELSPRKPRPTKGETVNDLERIDRLISQGEYESARSEVQAMLARYR